MSWVAIADFLSDKSCGPMCLSPEGEEYHDVPARDSFGEPVSKEVDAFSCVPPGGKGKQSQPPERGVSPPQSMPSSRRPRSSSCEPFRDARTAGPLVFGGVPSCGLPTLGMPSCSKDDVPDEMEDEFEVRRRITGLTGRVVQYDRGETPWEDIELRGGSGKRIEVNSIMHGGKAHLAGVKVGEVLTAVDGRRNLESLAAHVVQHNLLAPCTLVFVGFVGRLNAEVRLNVVPELCGLPVRKAGALDEAMRTWIVEQVLLDQRAGALWLATDSNLPDKAAKRRSVSADPCIAREFFELRPSEARNVVRGALHPEGGVPERRVRLGDHKAPPRQPSGPGPCHQCSPAAGSRNSREGMPLVPPLLAAKIPRSTAGRFIRQAADDTTETLTSPRQCTPPAPGICQVSNGPSPWPRHKVTESSVGSPLTDDSSGATAATIAPPQATPKSETTSSTDSRSWSPTAQKLRKHLFGTGDKKGLLSGRVDSRGSNGSSPRSRAAV